MLRKSIHKLLYCEKITQRKFVLLDLVKSHIMLDNVVTKFGSSRLTALCLRLIFQTDILWYSQSCLFFPIPGLVLSLPFTVLSRIYHSLSCLVFPIQCLESPFPCRILSPFPRLVSSLPFTVLLCLSLFLSCIVSLFHCFVSSLLFPDLSIPFCVVYLPFSVLPRHALSLSFLVLIHNFFIYQPILLICNTKLIRQIFAGFFSLKF